MKLLRKLLRTLMTVICVVVFGYSVYRTVTGQDPVEERLTAIGGLIAVGAFAIFIVFGKFWRGRNGVPPELIDDPDSIIQLRASPIDTWVMAVTFTLAAIGCGVTILGGALDLYGQVVAWLGVIAFGSVPLWLMLKWPVSLRLSPDGLDYSGFRIGRIAWSDIRSATLRNTGKIPSVVLDLSNEQAYLARGPKSISRAIERLFAFPPFAFAPPAMGVSAESIVKAIKIRASHFGRNGSGRVTQE